MGETEEKYEKSQSVSGPRFETGISRVYAYLAAHPEHRYCMSHSSERSLQADSVDTLFLSEKKILAESFVSVHFIFPCHHTDYDHLLLNPNTPFPPPLFFLTCPRSSVNGPTTTYTASSGMFGNFRPRVSRVPATRRVRYNWRLFEALSSNALPPSPPLTQLLPNGTPISPQYTLVVLSATFPFSKCQQGVTITCLPALSLRRTHTW